MKRLAVLALLFAVACDPASREAEQPVTTAAPVSVTPSPRGGFTLVGGDSLLGRGMNAGLAVHGRYAYVGSRTDGTHRDAEVLVVDVGDLARPRVIGRIGRPHTANIGESSRELRVWPERNLLIVMNIPCEAALHACGTPPAEATVRFFDIAGARASAPALVATYRPSATPHEMFLWIDPARRGRALLWLSTNLAGAGRTSLLVADISDARSGRVREVLAWRGNELAGNLHARLHSVTTSRDGSRAFLSYARAGVVVLDTSDLAAGAARPSVRLLTSGPAAWPGVGVHSAVPVEGRNLVVTTDEVYGGAGSCPWDWLRVVDVTDPRRPRIAGEHRLAQNHERFCKGAPRGSYTFSAHAPTPVGDDLVLVSWHAGGLRAVSVAEPGRPSEVAAFSPLPLERVAVEDPALTTGEVRVAVWSSPIVWRGLIYVVDVRNGLFILRLGGLSGVSFADGGSNLSGQD